MGVIQWPIRLALLVGALSFAMPGNDVVGLGNLELFIIGLVLTGGATLLAVLARKLSPAN